MPHSDNNKPLLPLNISLVIYNLQMGGAEQQVIRLSQVLDPEMIKLCVVTMVPEEKNDLSSLIPEWVKVFHSPYPRYSPKTIFWLAGIIRDEKVKLAHSFLWIPDAYTSLTRLVNHHFSLVCSERGDRSAQIYYSWKRLCFDRLVTFKQANAFCANSTYGANLLTSAGCPSKNISVIQNGIDNKEIADASAENLRGRLHWPEDSVLVISVSRLVWYKGVDFLLRAFADIPPEKKVYGVILGDGPDKPMLESLANELDLKNRVIFLGQCSPAIPFIKACNIGVLNSTSSEHCSNTILEYMACSLPVIATNLGGNPELVHHGETGMLIPPKDIKKLTEAIISLAENPERRVEMGNNGKKLIDKNFAMSKVGSQYVELWRSVILSDKHSTDRRYDVS